MQLAAAAHLSAAAYLGDMPWPKVGPAKDGTQGFSRGLHFGR